MRKLMAIGVLLVLMLVISACGSAETPTPCPQVKPPECPTCPEPEACPDCPEAPECPECPVCPTEEPPPEITMLPEQEGNTADWEASPHGNTYDEGKGPNTYCSRCHSPQNWDPTSTTGPPPNCVTCKFPTDEALRIATTMDFVAEEDWVGINCETCHQVEDGIVLEGISWLNPLTMEYDEVGSPNELCAKCHLTSSGVSASGGTGVTHEIYLGGSAHKNWAGVLTAVHRPEYCSDCHDPHTQVPLGCEDCHASVLTLDTHIKGKNAEHANVTCMACHDATGLDVGPHPDEAMGGIWVLQETTMGRGGAPSTTVLISHSPQWQVSCDRCHFEENPWELTVYTAAGEIPPTPTPAP